MEIDVIYNENCLKMRRLPDESIDLIPTDPQYGWNFMGKDWDRAVPSVDIWRQCFRVLKSGAFAFIMSGPRLDCLIENGMRIREAGFVISFTPIFWCFASGFPKAQNIGKTVDKRLKVNRRIVGYAKDISHIEREDKNIDSQKDSTSDSLFTERQANLITKPATPQARSLDGSYGGFQPKPAVEVILVAMKPLSEKTYVDQALNNRKGITWLDGGRIPYESQDLENRKSRDGREAVNKEYKGRLFAREKAKICTNYIGRFPANLLVSDDALNDGRVIKSSYITGKGDLTYFGGDKSGNIPKTKRFDDGSFSRYFSLDAWFDKKLKELPAGVQKTFPFLIVPKASKAEKNRGCERLDNKLMARSGGAQQAEKQGKEEYLQKHIGLNRITKVKNNHPTCKPIKLFSYLITLGSRPGDIILDPFIGSGTTAIAARMLGRHYIGYEIDKDYCEIAKARLSEVQLELCR